MITRNDGGPAFPVPGVAHAGEIHGACRGMSLRDHFAGIALRALIELESDAGLEGEVKDAYRYADKMIEEGEKQ